ncbi:28S ribosomal protein S31, mitochondrial-like [Biomphalaria glabrata]|uniref:Small ribosomal subunit protein mS31 n=1 Tax=Biomphalaria glabrata TaxID=6526 RepID=A0A9W3ALV7_BIOGL|nr:28S ribosomal protein S31, mitochondrial-like [Biomphalaria glabrata]
MLRTLAHNLLATTGLESRCLLAASLRLLQLTPERHLSTKKEDPANNRELQNKELKNAAITVAKSLQGDWTRTAEDLLSRLQLMETPEQKDPVEVKEGEESLTSSLLQTMKVGRDISISRPERVRQMTRHEAFPQGVPFAEPVAPYRKRLSRKDEMFSELYSVPRLGIFDPDKVKTIADQPVVRPGLFELVNEETLQSRMSPLPKNAFEEMIKWTKEGKLWTFPIDNEADMHEEKKYSFQDHVFFDKFLTEFPPKGAVRKFMELVTLGLSMNPYISVPEKHDHIRWFADYFRQKKEVLTEVLGEDGNMKDAVMTTSAAKKKADKKTSKQAKTV